MKNTFFNRKELIYKLEYINHNLKNHWPKEIIFVFKPERPTKLKFELNPIKGINLIKKFLRNIY